MLTRRWVSVVAIEGEIAFSSDALDGIDVNVWVEALIAGDGFVQETFTFLLLPPQAGADQTNAVDDDEVAIGPGCKFVIQLKRDVVGVRGVEDFTCLLYTSPSPRDKRQSRMPSSA